VHTVDESIPLLREGYEYAARRRRRLGTDAFCTRLGGRAALVLGGSPESVRLFYDETRVKREAAVPGPVRRTLFGRGAVHGLDGAAHKHRKAMFLDLLTPDAAAYIATGAHNRWNALLASGPLTELRLFDAATRIHAEAVRAWAGIPVAATYPDLPTDLGTIVDGFGSFGRRHVRAVRSRRRADRWASALVAAVRGRSVAPPDGSALARITWHRDVDGELLSEHVAGVELLNILRPSVAVAWLVVFAALTLHDRPDFATLVHTGDDATLESFAHEVRRLCPFVPVLAGRVRQDFEWRGQRIQRGARIVLDVYGTLHDPQLWTDPETFEPTRFADVEPDAYTLIPQGGGPRDGHRCPGERIAVELIKAAARWLTSVSYDVPDQDLRLPLDRMPTRPRSGLLLTHVHERQTVPAQEG
jgi:fatty-acid peroxygenase